MTTSFEDSVGAWLGDRLGVKNGRVVGVRRHAEGFSWQTFTFDFCWTDDDGVEQTQGIAIRREPEDGLLAPYDIVGQYRLHELLTETSIPVPALIGLNTDAQLLGMPFYAMERVDGVVPVQWQGGDTSIFPDNETRHRVGIEFVDTLADIHSIDPARNGVDGLIPGPGGTDPGTAELDRWEQFLDDATLVEVPLIRSAIDWCRRHRAISGRTAVCHGDYRIGNFMLRDGRIVAVFDWELAHVGDPVEDLAWAGLKLFRGRSPLMSQLLPVDEALARYRDRTGLDVEPDVFRFWTVVAMIRAAAPHLRAAAAFESGRSRDLRLAAMGHQTMHVLRQLARELGWTKTNGAIQ